MNKADLFFAIAMACFAVAGIIMEVSLLYWIYSQSTLAGVILTLAILGLDFFIIATCFLE